MTFDRTKPNNQLPLLPPKAVNLESPAILKASLSASSAIGALRAMIRQDERNITHAINLMTPLFVPEAVASSGVENIITTNEQVYRALAENSRGVSPAEKEAISYVRAITKGLEIVGARGSLATNSYLDIQHILEPKKSGLRKLPGTVLSNPITKEIYYTPPVGEARIRDLLTNFERYYNEPAPAHEVYARMAILHYQFEAIHPFYDGNGRTGRMLMPLYLMLQKQLDLPVLFISRYILEHRDEYYQCLRGVTQSEDWEPWILFVVRATTEQAKYTAGILENIHDTVAAVRKELQVTPALAHRVNLVEFIFSEPFFDVVRFQKGLDISYATARKYLTILEDKKLVVKKKQKGRNRFLYANPRYIAILKRT